jgi:hypothetical protein
MAHSYYLLFPPVVGIAGAAVILLGWLSILCLATDVVQASGSAIFSGGKPLFPVSVCYFWLGATLPGGGYRRDPRSEDH